jgi:predicted dehydrogenase
MTPTRPKTFLIDLDGTLYFIREAVDEPIEIDHGALPEEVPVFYYKLNHFAMAIAGEVAPDVSAPDAYVFMQILDALYDSAKSGEKVYIPSQ